MWTIVVYYLKLWLEPKDNQKQFLYLFFSAHLHNRRLSIPIFVGIHEFRYAAWNSRENADRFWLIGQLTAVMSGESRGDITALAPRHNTDNYTQPYAWDWAEQTQSWLPPAWLHTHTHTSQFSQCMLQVEWGERLQTDITERSRRGQPEGVWEHASDITS